MHDVTAKLVESLLKGKGAIVSLGKDGALCIGASIRRLGGTT
jgi:hypothetical protein